MYSRLHVFVQSRWHEEEARAFIEGINQEQRESLGE